MSRAFWLLLVFTAAVRAQDDPCGCGDDEGITIDGKGSDDESYDIDVDPFEKVEETDEPNKPPPVKVGEWQPPELDAAARKQLEALRDEAARSPDDLGLKYRLAEFYLAHRWYPHAERAFLASAGADPDSIRPWEGLLRVYRARPVRRNPDEIIRIVVRAGGGIVIEDLLQQNEADWLPSEAERRHRITRAFEEIVKRRPDDVARRRAFVEHLQEARAYERLVVQAREILARLPGDADTRYELAEALRKTAARLENRGKGSGAARLAEAFELFEKNHADAPDHAATSLRLARMIAIRDGTKAEERIRELESRGFFHLFVRPELAAIPYRADTLRMARDLAGPRIAARLWDGALMPAWYRDQRRWGYDTPHYQRWVTIYFQHAQPRARIRVIAKLARRGDREAAGILVLYLWHLEAPDFYPETEVEQRAVITRLENAVIDAVAGLGGVAYPAAERFLKSATYAHHRRRAVDLVRRLGDPRAVRPLLDALAWDVEKDASYGVASTLEKLGDAQAIDALVDAALDVRRPAARRREAAEALAAFEDARCVEALSQLSKEEGLRLIAAYGLYRLTADAASLQRLQEGFLGETNAAEVARLLGKCEPSRGIESVLVKGLNEAPRAVRPYLFRLLKERYWKTAQKEVIEALLKEAESLDVSDHTIRELGEYGGQDAADRLMRLVDGLRGERWATAARALARTGDPRAVRYFSRIRIVDRDPGRRRLAEELYEVASRRRAELARAGR